MAWRWVSLLLPALTAACATMPTPPHPVALAETAFARMATEQGQWTAFTAWSSPEAVMFVPQPVNAHEFLQGRADPPHSVTWQPREVWASCDGSLAFSKGPWQRPDGTVGYFTTLWQRQADGGYKWLLDQGDALDAPLPPLAAPAVTVADCPAAGSSREVTSDRAMTAEGERFSFGSADGTLSLTLTVATDLTRTWQLRLRQGGTMQVVNEGHVAGPEG